MKAIVLVGHFLVNTADFDNNQYNYLLSYEQDSKIYLIAYNSKKKYEEQQILNLKLKLDCEKIGGSKGNIHICNTLDK